MNAVVGEIIASETQAPAVWDDSNIFTSTKMTPKNLSNASTGGDMYRPLSITVTHVLAPDTLRVEAISVNILDLNSSQFRLKQPLNLLLHKEGIDYYAECVDFDVYGIGKDEKDSIVDLKSNFLMYYKSLLENPKILSEKLQGKLLVLNSIIDGNDRK